MTQQTRTIVIGVIVVIIIAVLGYFAWQERGGNGAPMATSTASVSTSTGVSINVSSTTTSGPGYTITPITTSNSGAPAAPNYKTPLTFSSDIGADEQGSYQSQFATIQTTLASDSTDYSSWIALGALREETGDYQGAATDWKYVTEIYPTDPTAYANLGDLYANYLNQPVQAEGYYKQAIALDPTKEVNFYENLAQIYEQQGDTADAKAALQQGITAQVVGYQNLQTMLSQMQ